MQCKRPRVQGLRVPLGSMMQASKGPRAPRSKGAIGLNDLWALLAPWALGLLTPGRPRLKGSLKNPWIHGSRLGPLGPWVLGPLGAQKGSRVQESNYPGIEGNKVLPPPAPANLDPPPPAHRDPLALVTPSDSRPCPSLARTSDPPPPPKDVRARHA